jgi:hypothetical protein
VEQWEDEKGMETILPLKINQYRIQREMEKRISSSRLQKNKDRLSKGTQQSTQVYPEKRNPSRNQ